MDSTKWPATNVAMRPVAELVPYARNARTHGDGQVAKIAASIREWGWTNPVLVDEDGTIIAGHGRVMAAQVLAIKDVPCMVAAGWTDAQKRAYVLADNRIALDAGWDEEMLRVEMSEIHDLGDLDMDLTGFSQAEVEDFITEPDFQPQPEASAAKLDEKEPTTCPNCGHQF